MFPETIKGLVFSCRNDNKNFYFSTSRDNPIAGILSMYLLANMIENTRKNKKAKEEQNNEKLLQPEINLCKEFGKIELYECRGTWTTLSLKQIRPLRRVLEVTLDVRLPGYNDNDGSSMHFQDRPAN